MCISILIHLLTIYEIKSKKLLFAIIGSDVKRFRIFKIIFNICFGQGDVEAGSIPCPLFKMPEIFGDFLGSIQKCYEILKFCTKSGRKYLRTRSGEYNIILFTIYNIIFKTKFLTRNFFNTKFC